MSFTPLRNRLLAAGMLCAFQAWPGFGSAVAADQVRKDPERKEPAKATAQQKRPVFPDLLDEPRKVPTFKPPPPPPEDTELPPTIDGRDPKAMQTAARKFRRGTHPDVRPSR